MAVIEEDGDQDLLMRIARHRDKAAFEELVSRFHQDAFNLAVHITGNQALAEEAVQEALLRVWLSARTFRADGNARGWILRIVCRECLRKRQDRRKESLAMTREEERRRALSEHEEPAGEAQELLAGLRACFGRLPDQHRQLIALYFGGGLTQREISSEMDVPERTVSYRIDEALRWMRENLKEAGLAAAVPMLNAEGLGNALCTGPVPNGLAERVLQAARSAVAHSAKHSLRAAGGWSFASRLMVAIVVAGAVGGGWALYHSLKDESPAAPAPEAARVGDRVAPATKKRITSDFESGMPQNLAIDGAAVKVVGTGGKTGGGLKIGFDKAAAEVYGEGAPCQIRTLENLTPPLRVSFAIRGHSKSVFSSIKSFWLPPGERIARVAQVYERPKREWRNKGPLPKNFDPDHWLAVTLYVTADEVKGFYDGMLHIYHPLKAPKRAPSDTYGFVVSVESGSVVVDDVVIEEIDAADVPDVSDLIILEPESSHD